VNLEYVNVYFSPSEEKQVAEMFFSVLKNNLGLQSFKTLDSDCLRNEGGKLLGQFLSIS